MNVLVCTPAPDERVRNFERRMRDGIDMYCQILWQKAPAQARDRYPRFGMTPLMFDARLRTFKKDESISLETVAVILNSLVPLKTCNDGTLDMRAVGTILSQASFAGCLLGYPASAGDVDIAVTSFRPASCPEDPVVVETPYRQCVGEPGFLLCYLNHQLGESLERFSRLSRGPDESNPEKRVFRYEPDEDRVCADRDVVSTYYPLNRSLVAAVEPVVGHA